MQDGMGVDGCDGGEVVVGGGTDQWMSMSGSCAVSASATAVIPPRSMCRASEVGDRQPSATEGLAGILAGRIPPAASLTPPKTEKAPASGASSRRSRDRQRRRR